MNTLIAVAASVEPSEALAGGALGLVGIMFILGFLYLISGIFR